MSESTDAQLALETYMTTNWSNKPSLPTIDPIAVRTAARRQRLAHALPHNTLVIPTNEPRPRTFAEDYPFRPGSDFFWLTGYREPNAVLVLHNGDAELFMQAPYDKTTKQSYADATNGEFWIGERANLQQTSHALQLSCRPIDELAQYLEDIPPERIAVVRGCDTRVAPYATNVTSDNTLASEIAKLRLVKDVDEIATMRDAANATSQALHACMNELNVAMKNPHGERWIEGTFARHARLLGEGVAYPSIVAAGKHATVLHWMRNDGDIRDGDLLLIDAGAESQSYYAADVTRTVPVNGHFTKPQRAVYEIVLRAQLAAIEAIKPGVSFRDPHKAAIEVLAEGLVELGVVSSNASRDTQFGLHRRFMPHGTSHPLGLDVHDCLAVQGLSDTWGTLEPGNVMTVEPGLYFQPDDELVPAQLRGIGIRIEDDVLVTKDGSDVLTSAIPKHADDVESWVQRSRGLKNG